MARRIILKRKLRIDHGPPTVTERDRRSAYDMSVVEAVTEIHNGKHDIRPRMIVSTTEAEGPFVVVCFLANEVGNLCAKLLHKINGIPEEIYVSLKSLSPYEKPLPHKPVRSLDEDEEDEECKEEDEEEGVYLDDDGVLHLPPEAAYDIAHMDREEFEEWLDDGVEDDTLRRELIKYRRRTRGI